MDYGVTYLSELVARQIPVLLIDTMERAITLNQHADSSGPKTNLAVESDAFPLLTADQETRITVNTDKTVNLSGRMELLNIAQSMIERKWNAQIAHNTVDVLNASVYALIHSTLQLGTDSIASGVCVPLHVRIKEMARLERTNKDSKKSHLSPELAAKACDIIMTTDDSLSNTAKLNKVEHWIANDPPISNEVYQHLYKEAIKYKEELQTSVDFTRANNGIAQSTSVRTKFWLATYDVLTSPNTFSGELCLLLGIDCHE